MQWQCAAVYPHLVPATWMPPMARVSRLVKLVASLRISSSVTLNPSLAAQMAPVWDTMAAPLTAWRKVNNFSLLTS